MIVYLSIRVVQQYEKMVVFRLGRTNESMVRDPGLRFLVPIIDRPVKVDVREQFIEVPSQTTITRDNAPINVDFLIYWRISDPLKSVVNVANFPGALQGVATTTLRAVIGDILLDEVLSKREQINEVLRVKLDEVTERWGGKVTTVEIREITPPRDVQDAMNRQLSAERTRRAVITESEGSRQAAINVAEGQKQAEILKAEGDRQAAILRAEGFSEALTRIYGAASGIDAKTMALQYLEALKALGSSPSTKFVIPTEFTRLLEPIAGYRRAGHGARRRQPASGGALIRRLAVFAGLAALPAAAARLVIGRGASRLLDAPRTTEAEAALGPELDALGGEVVRLRSRDGLRLAGRWLPADRTERARERRRPTRRPGGPTRTRRSCCSTAGRARSRPISSSTGRSCAGRPASSASTSGATASPTTRRRRSGSTRSRTSPARWPGSASGGSRASRLFGTVDGRHHRARLDRRPRRRVAAGRGRRSGCTRRTTSPRRDRGSWPPSRIPCRRS